MLYYGSFYCGTSSLNTSAHKFFDLTVSLRAVVKKNTYSCYPYCIYCYESKIGTATARNRAVIFLNSQSQAHQSPVVTFVLSNCSRFNFFFLILVIAYVLIVNPPLHTNILLTGILQVFFATTFSRSVDYPS